ncbi:S-adenosylmethionine carrier 1, chloroplastic/mitochondrial-like isoform X2 [Coffea arabica]|uniref:S-adenosylmethionine carrier 1, chloroplastic/mitochondrial-like isoform X2 n=1 Tax=Coffea arabica TaxID=13443 RepID=A0ABM4VNG5_COFAR
MSINADTDSPGILKHQTGNVKHQMKGAATTFRNEHDPFDFMRFLYEGAVAGATAGVVVESVLYPIDTIKTRLQAVHGGGKIILRGLYSGLAGNLVGVLPASAIFVGVYEPTKQMLLKSFPESLSALAYLTAGAVGGVASSIVRVPTEGFGSFLLRDLPFDAVQFCIYEQLRIGYKLAARRDLNDPETAMIGAFAGAITGAITTPLDVIKTRLMVQGSAKQYEGILHCVGTIVREEGTSSLFKGIGPRVLWIGIGGSIFFGVLERTKKLLSNSGPIHPSPDSLKQD